MAFRPAVRSRARAAAALLTVAATVTAGLSAAGTTPAAAAPAPSGRPGAAAVKAAPAGSNALRLTWHNPGAAGRAGTVIRYAVGTKAPRSPRAGHAAGRPGPTRTSATVTGLRPATRYAFALFTSYGHGRYGARAVARGTTGPDAVRGVQPYAHRSTVTVTWRPPRRDSYATTVVRYASGGRAPVNPHDGHPVPLTGPQATSARLTGLTPAATYAVAIWVRDSSGRYSSVATNRFTTLAPAKTETGTVSGTVTDDAAHPLAHVDVLVVDGDSAASWSTTTDGSGHYAITVPAGGVTVVLAGDSATGGDGDTGGYQYAVNQADVPAGGTATVNGALVPGGEVDGQVTDKDGNPLAGVGVTVTAPDSYVSQNGGFFIVSFSTNGAPTTGADGRFRLRGLPAVAEKICYQPDAAPVTGGSSDASGYLGRCQARTVAVAAGDIRTLPSTALLPAATGAVLGRVTDSSGRPLPGVIVNVMNRDPQQDAGEAAQQTDATGHYRVGNLPPGRYDVCADPTGIPLPAGSVGNAPTCRFASATITSGHSATVNVRLRAAGALGGRLTGPTGRSEPGVAFVQSQGGPEAGIGLADRHGQYVVPNLAPGWYRVCFVAFEISGSGAQPGCYRDGDLVQVRRGVTRLGVDARLAAAGAVSGHLSGVDVTDDLAVEADDPANDDEEVLAVSTIDDHGNYRITGLPAGHYQICAFSFSAGVAACHRGLVTVRTGHVTSGVDIAFAATSAITTTVTNEAGHPVSGVDVAVLAPCPDDEECPVLPAFDAKIAPDVVATDMTDGAGRVRLSVPRSGSYAVCAFTYYGAAVAGDPATGYLDACTGHGTFGVAVQKGKDTAQAFTLHPAGAVSGHVTDKSGHPLAGVRLRVSDSSSSDYYDVDAFAWFDDFSVPGPASEVISGPDGGYFVPGVRPGMRSVCFDAGDAVDLTGTAHPNGIVDQCAGGKPGTLPGPASVSVPDAGTVTGVDQQLSDAAVISGRVVDRSSGKPLRGVGALLLAGGAPLGDAVTDAKGRYRLDGVPPGTVTLCFVAFEYQSQCYDNVPWPGKDIPKNATPIHTTSGATVTLKDVRLRPE